MARFIGIDLAWSGRNPTGLAVLDYDPETQIATLIAPPTETILTDEQITAFVKEWGTNHQTLVVAIDAPLCVPNIDGQRLAERQIGRSFSVFQAGAHSANISILGKHNGGQVRGETIVKMLAELDIQHSPMINVRQPTRQVFEVYPHPAMVVLFKLNQTLKYKKRSPQRKDAFRHYQSHLQNLQNAIPPLHMPPELDLLSETHLMKRGKTLKAYEDQLDAIFCAYIGLYYWYWGLERCHIFGDSASQYSTGYIVSPVDERVKNLIR